MSAPLLAAWKDRAACRTTPIYRDADPFYPEAPITLRSWADGRRICNGCPVKDACLEDALAHNDVQGMRAGLTPKTLVMLRAERNGRTPPAPKPVTPKPSTGTTALRERIVELALSGMPASKIGVEVGRATVTIHHYLRTLRETGRIPVDAGCATPVVIPCGTLSGYRRHRRIKQKACDECRDAYNTSERARKAAL